MLGDGPSVSQPLLAPASVGRARPGVPVVVEGVRWLDTVLIAAGLVLLAARSHGFGAIDSLLRYQALVRFVHTGAPGPLQYQFVGPLLAVPLWYLGQLALDPEWWILRYNLLLLAAGLVGLWLLLRDRLEDRLLRAFLLLLVASSLFPAYTQDFLGEPFTAVLVAVGIAAGIAATAVPGRIAGWLAMILGVANTVAALPAAALVAGWHAVAARRLRFLAVPLGATALVAIDTWFRYGSPFASHYLSGDHGFPTVMPYSGRPGFSYPWPLGLLSILFSFGKGLVFFVPGLLLPVGSVLRRLDPVVAAIHRSWMVFLGGLVALYASWWAWYGGFYWGPRFFLIAVFPASLALATLLVHPPAHLLARTAVLLVLALSVWVGVEGVVFGQDGLTVCQANGYALEAMCWYVPDFSPLWHPFIAGAWPHSRAGLALLCYGLVVLLRLAWPLLRGLAHDLRHAVSAHRHLLRGWTV
jgi:hypothetical protein